MRCLCAFLLKLLELAHFFFSFVEYFVKWKELRFLFKDKIYLSEVVIQGKMQLDTFFFHLECLCFVNKEKILSSKGQLHIFFSYLISGMLLGSDVFIQSLIKSAAVWAQMYPSWLTVVRDGDDPSQQDPSCDGNLSLPPDGLSNYSVSHQCLMGSVRQLPGKNYRNWDISCGNRNMREILARTNLSIKQDPS